MSKTVTIVTLLAIFLIAFFVYLQISGPYSGPFPKETYLGEVKGLQSAYEEYRADMHSDPPTKNPDFFDALDGKNSLNKLYVRLGAKRDADGKVLDPWGKPFEVTILDGKVIVHSPGYDLYPDK